MDEHHRPVERRDLEPRQQAAPRDAIAREHVSAPEGLEPPLRRRSGAEGLAVFVQRPRSGGAHAAMARESKAKGEVDVLPVGEEALVEAEDTYVGKPLGEELGGAVGRGVVNHDDGVLDRLLLQGLERLGQQGGAVVGRDDHGCLHVGHDRRAVETTPDLLSTPEAGGRVIRGGLVRGIGYAAGTLLGAGTSVFLLRHLGRDDFGRYGTVAALLGVVSGISDAGLTAVGARELALAGAGERVRLMRNLVSLRLAITPVGIAAAAVFALVAYDRTMFW